MTSPIPTEGGMTSWLVSRSRDDTVGFPIQPGVYGWVNVGTPERARLIAAAPALLEALTSVDALLNLYPDDAEDIAAALGIENDGALREACAQVRAALALATGGEDVRR